MKTNVTLLSLFITLIINFSSAKNSDLEVFIIKTKVSCFGGSNGKISLNIIGGTPPYNIKWNDGSVGNIRENLRAGIYSYKVKDSFGNFKSDTVVISSPKPLSISFSTPPTTFVDNFNSNMNILIRGGRPWENQDGIPFYLLRIDGKSYYKNPEEIASGLHTLQIEDANYCKFDFKVNLNIELKKKKGENFSANEIKVSSPLINMLVLPYHLQNYNRSNKK